MSLFSVFPGSLPTTPKLPKFHFHSSSSTHYSFLITQNTQVMDTKFESLPPLKRLRLLQKQKQMDENKENEIIPHHLPAKKRKETRHFILPEPTITSSYRLPAKKRVWAFQPDFISAPPLSPFDLNLEYQPSFDQEFIKKDQINNNPLEIEACRKKEEQKETFIHVENSPFSVKTDHESVKEVKESAEIEEDDGILCAICQSTDGDPTDPIVFCDGCDLMVHASCYGNPLIKTVPKGDWFCAQCLASKSQNNTTFSCCLCPSKDGAMKPTNDGLWAHLVCAVFIPEVFFDDPDGREGVNCTKVPKRRWEDKCYLCKKRKGCVIQCSEPRCPLAFHITCGLKQDLCIEYKEGKRSTDTIVAGFCRSHTELWQKQQQTGKFKIVAEQGHK